MKKIGLYISYGKQFSCLSAGSIATDFLSLSLKQEIFSEIISAVLGQPATEFRETPLQIF